MLQQGEMWMNKDIASGVQEGAFHLQELMKNGQDSVQSQQRITQTESSQDGTKSEINGYRNRNRNDEEMSIFSEFKIQVSHVKLLLKKNFLVNMRHKYVFILQYLAPIMVCLMLILWQHVADQTVIFEIIDPEIKSQGMIPHCISPEYIVSQDLKDLKLKENKRGCISVGYHIIGKRELWVDQAMEYVARTNNLKFGSDVKLLSVGDPHQFQTFIKNHLNRTQIGVVFCTTSFPLKYDGYDIEIPCRSNQISPFYSGGILSDFINETLGYQLENLQDITPLVYTIIFNNTLNYKTQFLTDHKESVGKDDLARGLKISLDNALIEIVSKNSIEQFTRVYNKSIPYEDQRLLIDFSNNPMEVLTQEYPKVSNRFLQGFEIFAGTGAFYLFIPMMISFILLVNEMLREKENKLRQGLATMGLSHFSYITCWVIYSFISIAILQIVMISCGIIFEFNFFTRSPVIVTFSILFSFGMSLQSIGFFIASVCNDVKLGYTLSYAFLLFSVVMQMFMSSPSFIFILYQDDPSLFIQILLKAFSIYPAFHYSKLFQDVAQRANTHFDLSSGRWILGPGFYLEDIFNSFKGKFPFPPKEYHTPTPFASIIYLNLSSILFFVLAWYADHVVSSGRIIQI